MVEEFSTLFKIGCFFRLCFYHDNFCFIELHFKSASIEIRANENKKVAPSMRTTHPSIDSIIFTFNSNADVHTF